LIWAAHSCSDPNTNLVHTQHTTHTQTQTQLSWFRIILDEAHYIKTRSTSTAKAVFALTSLNKWCLTGTPLQNRVGELYSLVRFLRMNPHAYYFCRCATFDLMNVDGHRTWWI